MPSLSKKRSPPDYSRHWGDVGFCFQLVEKSAAIWLTSADGCHQDSWMLRAAQYQTRKWYLW